MSFILSEYPTNIGVNITDASAKLKFFAVDDSDKTITMVFNVYANEEAETAKKLAGQIRMVISSSPTVLVPEVKNEEGEVTSEAVMLPAYSNLQTDDPQSSALFN